MCKLGELTEIDLGGNYPILVDSCLAEELKNLNDTCGYKTLASCCGHGKYKKTIIVISKNHRRPIPFEINSGKPLTTKDGKPITRKFYIKDDEGHYFIPEVEGINTRRK